MILLWFNSKLTFEINIVLMYAQIFDLLWTELMLSNAQFCNLLMEEKGLSVRPAISEIIMS